LSSKTIIITGAAGGLGSALSRECVGEGYNTVMLDCDRRGLEAVWDNITREGQPEPALYPMDLLAAGPKQFEELLEKVTEEFGGLDAVVHCAARFEGLTPLEQNSPSEWLASVQVNLNAAWLLSAQSLPLLKQSGSGSLYFMLEDLPKMKGPFWGAYGVCKHALAALAGQFAAGCKSSDVQVLGINPGVMRSALRARSYHAENPELQPDAEIAAKQIVRFLKREVEPDTTLVDLKTD
jgi:NAD(P)-dependent dehydrogenase (short-subunit alcohol dehydrogenase family)